MFSACCSVLTFCVDIHLCFSGLSMQAEDVAKAGDVNKEEQPEAAANDRGPSTPRDGGDVAHDTAEGHQDVAGGDQNREV
jgi:hypothetical protein